MSARAVLLVLVLLSTRGQAPYDHQQEREYLTCQSQPKVLPCKDSGIPLWTTAMLLDTGPQSLVSEVSSHTHLSFLFLDPVSVTSMAVGGLCLQLLLGITAWTIITLVWVVCTAVISRINPLTRRRIIVVKKHYHASGRHLCMHYCTYTSANH